MKFETSFVFAKIYGSNKKKTNNNFNFRYEYKCTHFNFRYEYKCTDFKRQECKARIFNLNSIISYKYKYPIFYIQSYPQRMRLQRRPKTLKIKRCSCCFRLFLLSGSCRHSITILERKKLPGN